MEKKAGWMFILSLVFFTVISGRCDSTHGRSKAIEEYTVWPKDNASRLLEGYPWPSCDKTTGSQCPGLIDYLEHFCTREDNQGCHKRNESVSERHVVLKLLPGQHKMDLRENLKFKSFGGAEFSLTLDFFWFCEVSLNWKGSHLPGHSTEILTTTQRIPQSSTLRNRSKCEWIDRRFEQRYLWSLLAFRGGGVIRFEDLSFRHTPVQGDDAATPRTVIIVLDVRRFEMLRCNFVGMSENGGSLTVLYSDNSFPVTIVDCHFQLDYVFHRFRRSVPAPMVSVRSFKKMLRVSRTLLARPTTPRLPVNASVQVHHSTFTLRHNKFSPFYPYPRYVKKLFN